MQQQLCSSTFGKRKTVQLVRSNDIVQFQEKIVIQIVQEMIFEQRLKLQTSILKGRVFELFDGTRSNNIQELAYIPCIYYSS